jgi:hypothetical protein
MSFLAPLFLLGGLALALPVLFHLIRRTSRERTVFSSLMFLNPTPPRITRRSRLENIFLLLLRCIVLCLLALSFARPFIQRPLQADPKAGAGKRTLILLDTSASMRRGGLWAEAQAKAGKVLRQAAPNDQVALFTFDRQVGRVLNFEQWTATGESERAGLAVKRVSELTPGWSGTHLGNALVTAAEAMEEGRGVEKEGFASRQVVVISDLQEGSRLDNLQGYEWPKGVELRIEPVKSRRLSNAGLQLVTETAEGEKGQADAGPRVRVSNSADSKREQFQIGWARAGQTGFIGTPVEAYVPPGQSRILKAPKLPPGQSADRLLLTGDEEEFDNVAFVATPKAQQVNLLFAGTDAEKDPAQCLFYLKKAFQQTPREDVQVTAWAPNGPAPAEQWERAPLVISTEAASVEQFKALNGFLKKGKVVLLVLKGAAEAGRSISEIAGINAVNVEEAPVDSYAMLGQIDFEHPLFAPFASPKFSDFTKIHFWKHRRVGVEQIPAAKVLARFDNGDAALSQIPVGGGSLLVLASGWHPADSQLALSSKFVPLLYSILEQSGGFSTPLSQYLVGDPVPLPGLEAGTNAAVVVRKPDGSQARVATGEKFTQTDLPGVYTVFAADSGSASEPTAVRVSSSGGQSNQPASTASGASFQFAVNLDPAESKTAPLALEQLERLGVAVKFQPTQTAAQRQRQQQHLQAAELEQRQKLWRWLIVAALVLLVMETLLAGWLTRRSVVTQAA